MKTLILSALILFTTLGLNTSGQAQYRQEQRRERPRVQFHISFGQRHRNRNYDRGYRGIPYSTLETRYERYYGHEYRCTYRVTYLPNGRTETRLIERVQVY
jgi:hypothetical protein